MGGWRDVAILHLPRPPTLSSFFHLSIRAPTNSLRIAIILFFFFSISECVGVGKPHTLDNSPVSSTFSLSSY